MDFTTPRSAWWLRIVGTYADPGTFSLDVQVEDTLPGQVCETAIAITPGTLNNQTTVGYSNSYAYQISTCTDYADFGPDRVYSIHVPAGKELTATAKPESTFDVSIYLIRGPATQCRIDEPCLVGTDGANAGGTETVTYTNESQAEETIFIIVDGFDRTVDGGRFSLSTSITSP
jgi:hypothetical protein